jgi:hypothetical protein
VPKFKHAYEFAYSIRDKEFLENVWLLALQGECFSTGLLSFMV